MIPALLSAAMLSFAAPEVQSPQVTPEPDVTAPAPDTAEAAPDTAEAEPDAAEAEPDTADPEPTDAAPPIVDEAPEASETATPGLVPSNTTTTSTPPAAAQPTAPAPAAAPRASTPEAELPPRQTKLGPAASSDHLREAAFLGLSVGVTNCTQPDCFDITIAGRGGLEFGYRFGIAALVVSTSVGGAKLSLPDEYSSQVSGSALFFDAGAGLRVFPVRRGPVDPYLGAELGYMRLRWSFAGGGGSYDAWYSRGAVKLTGGFDFYVSERVSLGPRVDYLVPFAGKLCERGTGMSLSCEGLRNRIEAVVDSYERRSLRRSLAKPWSVSLQLQFHFG